MTSQDIGFADRVPGLFAYKDEVRCFFLNSWGYITFDQNYENSTHGNFELLFVIDKDALVRHTYVRSEGKKMRTIERILHLNRGQVLSVSNGTTQENPLSRFRFHPAVPDCPEVYPAKIPEMNLDEKYLFLDAVMEGFVTDEAYQGVKYRNEKRIAVAIQKDITIARNCIANNRLIPPECVYERVAKAVAAFQEAYQESLEREIEFPGPVPQPVQEPAD